MEQSIDYDVHNVAKEKRTKKLNFGSKKKQTKQDGYDKFDELIGKKTFNHKNEKSFKKNQKRFEYDYEEDFYEPEY